jgi:hypothetical protein
MPAGDALAFGAVVAAKSRIATPYATGIFIRFSALILNCR